MKKVDVAAKGGTNAVVMTCQMPWGDTPEETVQMFGAEAVDSNALANAKITVRAIINRGIKAGQKQEEIQKTLDAWKLGVSLPRTSADPTARIVSDWDKIPADVKKKLLADFKAKMPS